MTKELAQMIEKQINNELYSAYLYYDIAEYYRGKGLDGFHKWFEAHAHEEIDHAEKFTEYLHDREVNFKLHPIAAPDNHFTDFRQPIELLIAHERTVTESICAIYAQATKDADAATQSFLQWYVNEQMEEEKIAKEMLEKYDLFAKDGGMGLYQLNKDLSMSQGK